jgi:hypothetical protein
MKPVTDFLSIVAACLALTMFLAGCTSGSFNYQAYLDSSRSSGGRDNDHSIASTQQAGSLRESGGGVNEQGSAGAASPGSARESGGGNNEQTSGGFSSPNSDGGGGNRW